MTGVVLSRSTRPCESMHGHGWTFSEQVIAIIIDDSHFVMSDVAFRTAPPIGGLYCFLMLRKQRTRWERYHSNHRPLVWMVGWWTAAIPRYRFAFFLLEWQKWRKRVQCCRFCHRNSAERWVGSGRERFRYSWITRSRVYQLRHSTGKPLETVAVGQPDFDTFC